MFVSPDQKKDLCISSIQIVLIKDKIRSLKTLCIFCCCFIKTIYIYTIFLNVFSYLKWQKNKNFRTEKLSVDPNLGQKRIRKFF